MAAATGFQLVQARSGEEVSLAMQQLWLSGRVLAAGARLMVRHVFASQEKDPLEVIYSFALPRDAALRRFRVSGDGFSVRSELKPVAEAVKAYEAGIEGGHLSTLARQFWQDEGQPDGKAGEHWRRAEEQLRQRQTAGKQTQTQPARERTKN